MNWFRNNAVAIIMAIVSVTISVTGVYVKFTLDIHNLQRDIVELTEDYQNLKGRVDEHGHDLGYDFQKITRLETILETHFHE